MGRRPAHETMNPGFLYPLSSLVSIILKVSHSHPPETLVALGTEASAFRLGYWRVGSRAPRGRGTRQIETELRVF